MSFCAQPGSCLYTASGELVCQKGPAPPATAQTTPNSQMCKTHHAALANMNMKTNNTPWCSQSPQAKSLEHYANDLATQQIQQSSLQQLQQAQQQAQQVLRQAQQIQQIQARQQIN